MLKESKIIRRTRKTVIGPLSPGYLFARFELERVVSFAQGYLESWNLARYGLRWTPARTTDAVKERLNDSYVSPHPEHLKMGQIVHIKDGPLRGLEAVFVQEMKSRNRMLLLLNTLGLHAG